MSTDSEPKDISSVSSIDREILDVVKKIQKHLVFLEKKIDTLMEGGAEKSFREPRFSKPARSGSGSSAGGYPKRRSGSGPGKKPFGDKKPRAYPKAGGSSGGGFDRFRSGSGSGFSSPKKKKSFRSKKSES